jgi:hypothetical protein
VFLDASYNLLNGSIPRELTALPRLTTLLLDHNRLSGSFHKILYHGNYLFIY